MTEADWQACGNPRPLLEHLGRKADERKLRLFACACARDVWATLTDECSRRAVETAERFADGAADRPVMAEARGAMRADFRNRKRRVIFDEAWAETNDGDMAKERASEWAGAWDTAHYTLRAKSYEAAELAAWRGAEGQARLVRDIFGNPFRPVTLDPAWQTSTVVALAQAAYENRILPAGTLDPDRLATLADALEDAGCDNADILNHCRQPGEHVRGCWVLDLCLGLS